MYVNNFNCCGRLVAHPQVTQNNGNPFVTFTLALNKPKKPEAMYVDCIAWGPRGAAIAEYYRKGQELHITGEIELGSYVDREGIRRKSISVTIEKFSGGGYQHTTTRALLPRPPT